MSAITVTVGLYGPLAPHLGGVYVAQEPVTVEAGACVRDLLRQLDIDPADRGYLFINAVLCDAPGLYVSANEQLKDADRVDVFSLKHMWPYQYRDGIPMSDALKEAMREHGAMHHSYR